jgi:hypothetical protein
MINIEIMQLMNIREEWVKAYFLDVIARLSAKSKYEVLSTEDEWFLEYARNRILEAHMLHVQESAVASAIKTRGQHVVLRVIKGGKDGIQRESS